MRLFLSAGTTRRVRIVLLRATHLPFVSLIWIYEACRHFLHRQNSRFNPRSMAHNRNSSREPSASRCQDPHHPSVGEAHRLGPGKDRLNTDQHTARESIEQAGRVQLEDMVAAVERLRAQVERMETTIAVQQRD
ncbi:hypothetical protein NUU61_004604 [Penicillium alfredii]|uniref:Uncharacterized protein n=1 Tax=Penicillium alfredii TaxID=1506179 RepID=A0A9W9FLX9_9EURO|nr:uncharacterized protein NUU61_004604 [Penicillium alfredii]KAJ5102382.1 hypothetical protein NUU61_004604 [Penicillium alfredii]